MILQPFGVDDLLAAVPAAAIAVESGGRVVLVNDEWRRLIRRLSGRSSDISPGDDFRSTLAPAAADRHDLTERLLALVDETFGSDAGGSSFETDVPRSDGSCRAVVSARLVTSAVVDVTAGEPKVDPRRGGVVVVTIVAAPTVPRRDGQGDWRDPVTGLATRRLFVEIAEQTLGVARRRPYRVALVCVHLDALVPVRHQHGDSVADELVAAVALRAAGCIRPGDVMARVDGDRFVVLLPDILHDAVADIVARRLLAELSDPVALSGLLVDVEARVGAVIAERHDTPEALLAAAHDAALNGGVDDGTRRSTGEEPRPTPGPPALRSAPRSSDEAELDIRDLAHPQLLTYFQPIVDLETAAVVGAEALMRWNHPRHGVLDAARFIGLAAEAGMLGSIANASLLRAGETWSTMRSQLGEHPPQLFVNLSPEQLDDPLAVERIMEHLQRSGLDHDDVVLEITEEALGGRFVELVDQFRMLRSHGLRLAIDDFGAGYSSLGRLRHLHVQVLKVDRTMSTGIETDVRARRLLASVASMSAELDVDCVIEGCETARQAHVLAELGFRYVQGYHFGRPVDADAFVAQLRRRQLLASGGS